MEIITTNSQILRYKMRVCLLFLSLLCFGFCFSQSNCKTSERKLSKVDRYIIKGDSDKAIKLLSKIESKCMDPSFLSSIGDVYFHLKNIKKAQSFYLKSYKLKKFKYINHRSLSQFLQCLYESGNYKLFNQLVQDKDFQIPSVSNKITDLIEKNSFAFQYKQDSISFNPISLNINSQLDEYFPSMPINSDIIIYTSRDKTTR